MRSLVIKNTLGGLLAAFLLLLVFDLLLLNAAIDDDLTEASRLPVARPVMWIAGLLLGVGWGYIRGRRAIVADD